MGEPSTARSTTHATSDANVNLLISHDQQTYQPQHGLPKFMQQLGDFAADRSSAPQGLPPMQLPCDFGADWSRGNQQCTRGLLLVLTGLILRVTGHGSNYHQRLTHY